MRRMTGLTLLAFGAVFGLIFTAGVVGVFAGKPGDMLGVFLIASAFGLVGAGLIFAGLRLMRGAKPIGEAVGVGDRVGNYLANVTEAREVDGKPFGVVFRPATSSGKHRTPSALIVRADLLSPAALQFNRENWFDRMCKRLGIAREVQTRDRAFDQAVYVRGKSEAYAGEYLEDDAKREAVVALLDLGFQVVRLTGEQVEAEWPDFDPETHDRPELTEDAGAWLHILAHRVPDYDPDSMAHRSDTSKFVIGILWAVAIVYALTLFALIPYTPLRFGPIAITAMLTFAVVYVVFGWFAALALKGTSTSHDRWSKLMGVSLILIGMGSIGSVALFNGAADDAPQVTRTLVISHKDISTQKNNKKYHVYVPAWDGGGDVDFTVSQWEYDAVVPGRSSMEVTTGPGRLGIEWEKSHRLIR